MSDLDSGTQTEQAQVARQGELDRQERRIWRNVAIAAVVIAALLMALGWRFIAPRLDAAKKLDRAISLVNGSDATLGALDAAVTAVASAPSTPTATALRALDPQVKTARANLTEAAALIDAGLPKLNDDEQRTALLVQTGAQARLGLLDAGAEITVAAQRAAADPSIGNIATLTSLINTPGSAYKAARAKVQEADAALKAL